MTAAPYIFTREGTRLVPAEPWTAERLEDFPEGKHLKAATLVQPRSLPFQGYYWVMLSNIVKATGCAPKPEHLHKALLKLCGYVQPVYNKNGQVIELAVDSTRFEKMDQEDFQKYVDHAKRVLAEQLGIIWDEYERAA